MHLLEAPYCQSRSKGFAEKSGKLASKCQHRNKFKEIEINLCFKDR